MSYIAVTEPQSNPFAPLTSELVKQLRDNPIAIAEGLAGAPRVLDAALSTTVTNAGRDWVLLRTSTSVLGSVGTYAMLRTAEVSDVTALSAGQTRAGSGLRYANAGGVLVGGAPSGTWRLMGHLGAVPSGSDNPETRTSIWLRIS